MATTPNQKPVPSEDYANMRFNAGKFDEFMTSTASSYVDRLGITHLTVKGIQASVTGALLPANNLSDVQSAATSRTNLGATTIGSSVFTATSAANARTALGLTLTNSQTDSTLGSVLKVGDFGIGLSSADQAPSSADANSSVVPGLYRMAAGGLNKPVATGGMLRVSKSFATTIFQEYFVASSSVNYIRYSADTGTTWLSWVVQALGGANSDITSLTGLTTPLSTAQGGTGNATGLAATATALATARTFSTNLASTTAASFNGTANVTPGVTGTLPLTNGGTGGTTAAAARSSLGAMPSAGDVTGGNASAGTIGEFLSVTGTATALTTGAETVIASLSLTAGDWDVDGLFLDVPASGTTTTVVGGLDTGTAMPAFPYRVQVSGTFTFYNSMPVPVRRISLSTTTTVNLIHTALFTTGTCTATGFIRARRVR